MAHACSQPQDEPVGLRRAQHGQELPGGVLAAHREAASCGVVPEAVKNLLINAGPSGGRCVSARVGSGV